jgi:hypothetical protein
MSLVRAYRFRRGRPTAALLIAAAAMLPACSAERAAPGGTPLAVTLTDFKIAPTVITAVSGGLRFDVYNQSPVTQSSSSCRATFRRTVSHSGRTA